MVYPVISLYRAHRHCDDDDVVVARLDDDHSAVDVGRHPASALTILPEDLWSFLLLDDARLLLELSERWPTLDGFAGMRAVASTSAREASEYGPELREEHLSPSEGWRVVVTGTIRPFSGDWGVSLLTDKKRKYLKPVLPFKASPVTHSRRDLFWGSKLIFKKMTLRLEAQLDVEGEYASMNTNFVLPGTVDAYTLAALLHSTVANWIYEGYFGALRMSGGYMQVQAPQLRILPVPDLGHTKEDHEWAALVERYANLADIPVNGLRSNEASELLGVCGRAWTRTMGRVADTRRTFAVDVLDALGLRSRREQTPAFVIPRQDPILADLEAVPEDLGEFWTRMRASARQLHIRLTPRMEGKLTAVAHTAVQAFAECRAENDVIRNKADQLSSCVYGLTEEERARVASGHAKLAALTVTEDVDVSEDGSLEPSPE